MALAQGLSLAEGRTSSVALAPIASGGTFAVEMLDDTELNVRLVTDIERSLAERAHPTAAEGRYVLTFETAEIADPLDAGGELGSLDADTLRGVDVRINLWSTTRDSLLQGRQRATRAVPLIRLDMVVRDRAARQIVWQANGVGEIRSVDRYRILQRLVTGMLQNLGETVDGAIVQIR